MTICNHRISFLGVYIDTLTKDQSLYKVIKFISSPNKYHYQISLNVAKLVYAQKNYKLRKIINDADIINADGMPIALAARLLSHRQVTRMGGLDYITGLADKYPYLKFYFLGAKQEVVEKVVNFYKTRYNIKIVGYRNGYFSKESIPDVISGINRTNADVLFLALGTPAKEYFLFENRHHLNVKFAVGVGGAFDIIAGKTKRAPDFIQKMSMEWFFRLCQEPRRMWKRYAITNSFFIYYILKEYIFKRKR